MTDLILAGIVGLILGIGATMGIGAQMDKPQPQPDETSRGQQEVIKQLTNLDIVEKICSPEYLTKQSETKPNVSPELLCRELSCLVFSRVYRKHIEFHFHNGVLFDQTGRRTNRMY